MFYILRRKGLGLGSTKAIKELSKEEISIVRNDKLPEYFSEDDVILRWGCTSVLPTYPQYSYQILNKSNSISLVNNKSFFRQTLQLQAPQLIPKTWFTYEDPEITYPCILRPQHHAQGKNLFFCENKKDLEFHLSHNPIFPNTCYYISEYIPKVAEYRVMFIQSLVAWIANKIPANPEAIAWNVAKGGKFANVKWKNWPIDVIETAYQAYLISGLYLGGVDVMVDKDGRSYVLEINSAPSHTSPYRQSCTTKCIDYGITHNMFKHYPPDDNFKKYSKWLHPALKKV